MTNVLRIAHLKIAHHVCNPEVGKREIHLFNYLFIYSSGQFDLDTSSSSRLLHNTCPSIQVTNRDLFQIQKRNIR